MSTLLGDIWKMRGIAYALEDEADALEAIERIERHIMRLERRLKQQREACYQNGVPPDDIERIGYEKRWIQENAAEIIG